ncbi:MAG: phenylalanine--tRNA ligase subunit beta, partial [Gammaproteobacteria bacterium]|nr:phenylalanine--tRNA ligase subunit beta [Gammaproteobacteria bacterium]
MQKISEKWLREWIDPGVSINELAEHLTNLGLEVDGVTRQVLPGKGAVIAEVTSIDSHPNSQKLTICKVTDGTSNYDVVCGAPNVTPGLRTALVRVGGELADGTKIVKQKIGGFDSNGMLCSNVELGYGADSGKIVEFAPDTALGTSLNEVVDFDEVVIEIDLTPNRGDCFSIRGVAREVALVNQLKFNDLEVKPVEPKHYDIVPIELDDPVGCPRYLGRVIKRINPHAITPEWMVQR